MKYLLIILLLASCTKQKSDCKDLQIVHEFYSYQNGDTIYTNTKIENVGLLCDSTLNRAMQEPREYWKRTCDTPVIIEHMIYQFK